MWISRYLIQLTLRRKDGDLGQVLLKPQSLLYLFTSEAKTDESPQGEVAYAITFILITNRCNGQRTGSSKRQLLRNTMNAEKKPKTCMISK